MDTREVLITWGVPNGEVLKVEEIQASGERRTFDDRELAKLSSVGEWESLVAALEEAYAAGVRDATDEAGEEEGERSAAARMILWDEAARQELSRSVRRLILGRALGRLTTSKRPKTATSERKGTRNGARSHA
jgi:hypothetical protein